MAVDKSILFVSPDYHCSFIYRDALRRLGWRADIYVESGYPQKLLYDDSDILRAPQFKRLGGVGRYLEAVARCFFYLRVFRRYKYHFYYAHLDRINFFERKLGLNHVFGESFRIHLWLAKLWGCKIILFPSGCYEEETRENFSKLDGGNVCNNCALSDGRCDDRRNIAKFNLVRRYANMVVNWESFPSSQYAVTQCKYKALDLQLWRPDLPVPPEHRLPPSNNLRILHSYYKGDRDKSEKNIKGSPYVLEAIERLKAEGHAVEYMHISDVPSRDMRYYQAQADIVVEQLIYGWFGSTGVETMALGKPVVCYLRPAWKDYFLEQHPEYNELPIIEANTTTIYDVLKQLASDPIMRAQAATRSRRFAEQHFDVKQNAPALAQLLMQLS